MSTRAIHKVPIPVLGATLGLGLLLSGCVKQSLYDAKVAELRQHKESSAAQEAELYKQLKAREQRLSELEATTRDLGQRHEETSQRLLAANTERDQLRKQLDDSTALVGQLKERLEKLGQNVEKLTSERGALSKGLEEARSRLDEVRRQKAAAEARIQTYRDLLSKLRAMIDAGQLKVVIREGRMLIALANDVLFDSGKTEIKPEGQVALGQVAQVLVTIPDRKFLVAGHTDNVPIKTTRFPSNWELSTARAVEVTRFLIKNGMKPEVLAAAGHGEFDPVAKNETAEGRAQNRRIEIVLQPNIADLPALDAVK
jgi:chemotaxis protein MotB